MKGSSAGNTKAIKIGDLMVREGLLTSDALQKALDVQKKSNQSNSDPNSNNYKPLGQTCVELKLITKQDLQRFLSRHHKRIQIGELLMNMGLINQQQLNQVLKQQGFSSKRFGAILIQSGIISESQLVKALSIQLDIPRILPSPELIDISLLKGIEESFFKDNEFLPVHRHGNQMVVVMSDPLNTDLLEAIVDRYKCKITPAIAPGSEILKAIAYLFKPQTPAKKVIKPVYDHQLQELAHKGDPSKDQINSMVNFLIKSAVEVGATALHLESMESYLRLRLRIEGVLQHRTDLPVSLGPSLIECMKQPFRAKRSDYWREGIKLTIGRQQVELSVSFFAGLWGENLVLHITYIPPKLLGLEDMGFSPLNQKQLESFLNGSGGVLLASSPLHSGKSSLLYAAIAHLKHLTRSILTLEDRVDYPISGVIQNSYEVGNQDSFASLIEAMIDYDSDVIMVSELKDSEVCKSIEQAALSGKKVLTSLSACDTTAALHQVLSLQAAYLLNTPIPFLILTQRLIRKLCEDCKTTSMPSAEELRQLNISPCDRSQFTFWQAIGCESCDHKGYQGISAVHETLAFSELLRQALNQGVSASELRSLARTKQHMVSMAEDGVYKVTQGLTSLDEIRRVAIKHESDSSATRSLQEITALCQGKLF